MPRRTEVWKEGHEAGRFFGAQCPYAPGTKEARQWELGWSEAVLQRGNQVGNHPVSPPSEGWGARLRRWLSA